MANRRNDKHHPLGVVIPIVEEVTAEMAAQVAAEMAAYPDDSFEIYLAIKMPNGEKLDIKRRLSRDELERSLPWRRPDVVLQNIVNMGVEITKGLYLGPKPSSEIDEP